MSNEKQGCERRQVIGRFFWFGLFPLLGYVACYFLLTYPLVLQFSKCYFCDLGDGLQMIWDLWWVRHALLDLHQLPWHTHLLYYPQGTTLLLHSVSVLNGLISIPLAAVLSSVEMYNTIITLVFALSGLTAFWLAYAMTRAYWPSLAAGYLFTFSEIHYAHAVGHLGPSSMWVMPLFLILWLRMLMRPGAGIAIAAGVMLFLVLLTDQYLFLFSFLAAVVGIFWHLIRRRGLGEWKSRRGVTAAICFLVSSGLTSGVLLLAMARATRAQPFVGLHTHPEWYSADLVGLFVPGSTWEFRALTRSIWPPLGEPAEKNTSLSLAMLAAAAYGIRRKARQEIQAAGFWIAAAIVFTILALGPELMFHGVGIFYWMPYRFFEWIFPLLRFSGCPSRMLMMGQLAICVLAAGGLKQLAAATQPARTYIAIFFVLAMVIQSQPAVRFCVNPVVPRWVEILRDDPTPGAVLDSVEGDESIDLYFQTIHHRAMAFGQLSRSPLDAKQEADRQLQALREGDVAALKDFRFIVIRANDPELPLPEVFGDRTVRVYRLP